jgi:hypothetical protein
MTIFFTRSATSLMSVLRSWFMRLARRTSRLEFAGGTGTARLSDYPADFKAGRRKAKWNKPVG